jgi:hypothetical protein
MQTMAADSANMHNVSWHTPILLGFAVARIIFFENRRQTIDTDAV